MSRRYAIYWAPARDGALWRAGCTWLARDPERGDAALDPPALDGVEAARWRAWTDAPRRYGFHATLKAPFELAPGMDADSLIDACGDFARARAPVPLGPLQVDTLDGFVALVPVDPPLALGDFAFGCVRAFDAWRAAPSEAERARRRALGLGARELELLDRWGYPYVDDAFRLHLTLTGRLDDAMRAPAVEIARAWFAAALREPAVIDGIALFAQHGDAPFDLVQRFALSRR